MKKLFLVVVLFFTNSIYLFCQEHGNVQSNHATQNDIPLLVILVSLFTFFITLSFIHFLLYLFYRAQKTNLYYSIFVLVFGLIFLLIFFISISYDSNRQGVLAENYFVPLLSFFFTYLLGFIYSLFYSKTPKLFYYIQLLTVITVALYYLYSDFSFVIILPIILSVIISLVEVVKAIFKKKKGVIIASAVIAFLIIIVVTTVIAFTNGKGFEISTDSNVGVVLTFSLILCIPLSMSFYLAREFALTNKNLTKKLIEVEELSLKSIEQEKEKQKILETQNEVLEIQVKERTSEIVEQKKVIEEKNKDVTDSINYAKKIQESLLPATELKEKILSNAFVFFKPKDIISGDFYWFTEKDGCKIIVAADCTGHGVPGALMSMLGMNFLNQIVNEKGIVQPNNILEQLHLEIRKALKQDSKNLSNDGMDIAILTINSSNTIQYAGAHRPLIKIVDGKLEEIKADKFSIGGSQNESIRTFTNHTFNVVKNEMIYLYSDGFQDQFGGINGKKFMSKHFKTLLVKLSPQSIEQQKIAFEKTLNEWSGNMEQADDILVIGIKI